MIRPQTMLIASECGDLTPEHRTHMEDVCLGHAKPNEKSWRDQYVRDVSRLLAHLDELELGTNDSRPMDLEEYERTARLRFRDDDADGFELVILQASDGDFHLSVTPSAEDCERHDLDHMKDGDLMNHVRIRSPMIGGGSHAALWFSLADLFRKARRQAVNHKQA